MRPRHGLVALALLVPLLAQPAAGLVQVPSVVSAPWGAWVTEAPGAFPDLYQSRHAPIVLVEEGGRVIPYLILQHVVSNTLYLAHKEGGVWERELIGTSAYYWQNSLAIKDGIVHVAVVNPTNPMNLQLEYIRREAGVWTRELIDLGHSGNPVIQVDPNGEPVILYFQPGWTKLAQRAADGAWTTEIIMPGLQSGGLGNADVEFTRDGALHAVVGRSTQELVHLSNETGSWTLASISPACGIGNSLAISPVTDQLHVSCQTLPGGLHHFWREEGSWQGEVVDARGSDLRDYQPWRVGRETSIGVDSQGQPHIAYSVRPPVGPIYDPTGSGTIRYAAQSEEGWARETVGMIGQFNYRPMLALDSSDRPHISYVHAYTFDQQNLPIPEDAHRLAGDVFYAYPAAALARN